MSDTRRGPRPDTAEHDPANPAAPWLAFATCCLIWGSTFLFISIGNDALPPIWAATLRLALAAVALTVIALATRQRLPRGAAFQAAAQFGFLNFGINFALLYWGEKWVPSGLTAVIYGTIPLSTALFARVLGLERLHPLKITGALIGLAGVGAIFWGQIAAAVRPAGLVAVLVSATCASLSGVMLKRGPRQSAIGANAVGCFVGFWVCLAASFLTGEPHPIPTTMAALGPLLYLTVFGSLVAFVLFAWLVHRWTVTRASFIAVVIPAVALLLGALVRHERVTGVSLAGAALVLVGVVIGMVADRRRP